MKQFTERTAPAAQAAQAAQGPAHRALLNAFCSELWLNRLGVCLGQAFMYGVARYHMREHVDEFKKDSGKWMAHRSGSPS